MIVGLLHLGGILIGETKSLFSVLARPLQVSAHLYKCLLDGNSTFIEIASSNTMVSTAWLSISVAGVVIPAYLFLRNRLHRVDEKLLKLYAYPLMIDGIMQIVRQVSAQLGFTQKLPLFLSSFPSPPVGLLTLHLMPILLEDVLNINISSKTQTKLHRILAALQLQTSATSVLAMGDIYVSFILSVFGALQLWKAGELSTEWLNRVLIAILEFVEVAMSNAMAIGNRIWSLMSRVLLWLLPRLLRPRFVEAWDIFAPMALPCACAAFAFQSGQRAFIVVSSDTHPYSTFLLAFPLTLNAAHAALLVPTLIAGHAESRGWIACEWLFARPHAAMFARVLHFASGYSIFDAACAILGKIFGMCGSFVVNIVSLVMKYPRASCVSVVASNAYLCTRPDLLRAILARVDLGRVLRSSWAFIVSAAGYTFNPGPELIAALSCTSFMLMAKHVRNAVEISASSHQSAGVPNPRLLVTLQGSWRRIVDIARLLCKAVAMPAILGCARNRQGGVRDTIVCALVFAYIGGVVAVGKQAIFSESADESCWASDEIVMPKAEKSAMPESEAMPLPLQIYLSREENCTICLSPFQTVANDDMVDMATRVKKLCDMGLVVLPCGHCLHHTCFVQFHRQTPNFALKCPMCRKAIYYVGATVQNLFV